MSGEATASESAPARAIRASAARRPAAGSPGAGITLSLVIPAYREALRLPSTLDRIALFLPSLGHDCEVIVVDDGSPDATAAVARSFKSRFTTLRVLRHERNRGKGAAVRTGVLAASGRCIAFIDADLAAPVDALPRLLAALGQGADVAVASRRTRGADIARAQPVTRRVAGWAFRRLVRAIVPVGVSDTQCGLKAFRRDAARLLAQRSGVDGWAFDVEWLALARLEQLRVAEIPVRWSDDARSALVLRRAALQMFGDLWRIRATLRAPTPDPLAEPMAASVVSAG